LCDRARRICDLGLALAQKLRAERQAVRLEQLGFARAELSVAQREDCAERTRPVADYEPEGIGGLGTLRSRERQGLGPSAPLARDGSGHAAHARGAGALEPGAHARFVWADVR
jgi:hypothetical protein